MTRPCTIFAGRSSHGTVIRVQGSGTSAHSPALANFVLEGSQQHPDAVFFVDLLGCEYLDSTFLGCLLNLQRTLRERFKVVASQSLQKRLLAATKLDSYLTLVTTPPQTDGRFVKIEAGLLSERELGRHIMEAHAALAEIPGECAAAFRQIADRLKDELEHQGEGTKMADTVILPTHPPK